MKEMTIALKNLRFYLLRTLNILINALRISFVTFAVNSGISLNKFILKRILLYFKELNSM